MEFFEEINCSKATELMDYLNPNHKLWEMDPAFPIMQHWLFRGHADARWELKPSAWRNEVNDKINIARNQFHDKGFLGKVFRDLDIEGELVTFLIDNAYTELILLFNFTEMCNQHGMYVPDYPLVRHLMSQFLTFYNKEYLERHAINEELAFWHLDATAIAQHHGIPTRVLDWTYNGRKAAYFATSQQPKDSDPPSHISIFALRDSLFLINHQNCPPLIKLITAARYHDVFINAQEAVFTCDESGEDYYIQNRCFPSLETTLASRYTNCILGSSSGYKFTLPIAEIKPLKNLLTKENIHRASLMPTYDNVAKQSLINLGLSS